MDGAESSAEKQIVTDVFGIDVSALQAFQQAIAVTSNNVANASTPGYDEESILLAAAAPQTTGTASIGAGVEVQGVSRAFNQAAANQAECLAKRPWVSSRRCRITPARSTTISARPPGA